MVVLEGCVGCASRVTAVLGGVLAFKGGCAAWNALGGRGEVDEAEDG